MPIGVGLMAHLQQQFFFDRVKAKLPGWFTGVKVLEIGSLDINGSVRPMFEDCVYWGVDLADGAGVDEVAFGQDLTYPDRSFDVCISTECFEHNPEWVATFRNMHRMCSGLVVMTCATTGRAEHGTSRCHPGSSPFTASSDYYRNLTEQDFRDEFDLDAMFEAYAFEVESSSCDLYFAGLVQGFGDVG